MSGEHQQEQAERPGCRGCPIQGCPAEGREEAPSGWRLGLASAGLFLGPGVLAIIGAVCYSGSQIGQFLGAIGGLVIGMTGSVMIARLLGRAGRAGSTTTGDGGSGPGRR
jgi:hypothetical protein